MSHRPSATFKSTKRLLRNRQSLARHPSQRNRSQRSRRDSEVRTIKHLLPRRVKDKTSETADRALRISVSLCVETTIVLPSRCHQCLVGHLNLVRKLRRSTAGNPPCLQCSMDTFRIHGSPARGPPCPPWLVLQVVCNIAAKWISSRIRPHIHSCPRQPTAPAPVPFEDRKGPGQESFGSVGDQSWVPTESR